MSSIKPNPQSLQVKKTKIYCDKWVHEGVCAFTQQGCRFKHEMPMDKATQVSLGLFHGLPAWWKRHQMNLQRRQALQPLESSASVSLNSNFLAEIASEQMTPARGGTWNQNSARPGLQSPTVPVTPRRGSAQAISPDTAHTFSPPRSKDTCAFMTQFSPCGGEREGGPSVGFASPISPLMPGAAQRRPHSVWGPIEPPSKASNASIAP